jgi:hypothetical protein
MIVRRFLLVIPVLALFCAAGVIFLAAHAPRTWASHWANPTTVAHGAGAAEYGAAHSPEGWDILWVDNDHARLVLSTAASRYRPYVVDRGDVSEPSLLRVGSDELAAWVHDSNGGSAVMAADFSPGHEAHIFPIVRSAQPIEHPYVFSAGHGRFGVLFSWQGHGNFENYVSWITAGAPAGSTPVKLDTAQYYSFYPRAASPRSGNFGVLYLDQCCHQQLWNVLYRSYDVQGRPISSLHRLYQIVGYGNNQSIPSQWGEDLQTDGAGHVWGAFTGDQGIWLFEADSRGNIIQGPRLMDTQAGSPEAVDLELTGSASDQRGYVIWEQVYDLGSYVASQKFDRQLRPVGGPERVVYGSGSQINPHAAVVNGETDVVWQTVSRGTGSTFDVTQFRKSFAPTLAQRLGLGLGNPWAELAILLIGALGVATLTTTMNIILVIVIGFFGWLSLRLLSSVRSRWAIYAGLLTLALYYIFVTPGGPLFFLDTIPSLGLAAMPFGFVAAVGALGFVSWVGSVALRRIDDVYRAGIMAYLGVYFFAFLEAAVFIQQRLGYI